MNIENFDELIEVYKDNLINNDKRQNHYLVWKHPARVLIIAPSGGGKTNLLLNLVLKWLKYDRIYLYSITLSQEKYVFLINFLRKVEEETETEILTIGGDVEDIIKPEEMDRTKRNLVILDDFLPESKHKTIVGMFSYGRNYNASVIFLCQSYYSIHKDIRLNATHVLLFDNANKRETRTLAQDHAGELDSGQFVRIYNEATSEPHSFLYIDKTKRLPIEKYRSCFDGVLDPEFLKI